MIKLAKLIPNPDNPRTITEDKLEELKRSLSEFKKMMRIRPIVIDENNMILGGNMRYQGLVALGYTEVPNNWVKKEKGLTEDEKREFIVKDNVGFGEWNWEILMEEWDIDELSDWGLDVPEWKDEEEEQEAQDDDYEIPEEVTPDVAHGDIIQIGDHRMICASSTDVETWSMLMDGQLIDLVLTDPPYNVDYTGKTKDALKIKNDKMEDKVFYHFLCDFFNSVQGYTKKGGGYYIWHADSEGHNFRNAMTDSEIQIRQCLIWVKDTMVMGRQDYHWQHEPCLYGWKKGAAHSWYSDRKQTTVLEFDRPKRSAKHPTMKPVPLIGYQIQNSSKQGDIVADGFLGSGTTMVAAQQLGRRCFGVGLDPKYCQVVIERMHASFPDLEITINGKKYIPNGV